MVALVMIYLILLVSIALFGGAILFSKKNEKAHDLITKKIIPIALGVLFVVRFFSNVDPKVDSDNYSYFATLKGAFHLFGIYKTTFLDYLLNVIGILAIWFEITAAIMVLLRTKFHFKTSHWYVKHIALPIFIFCCIFAWPMLTMMTGSSQLGFTGVVLALELGGFLVLSIYYAYLDRDLHISKHSYGEVAAFSILINLATIPSYVLNFFFGAGKEYMIPLSFGPYHRIFIYTFVIIIPLGIYFALRNAHKDKIEYTLIFISIGTLFNFLGHYDYNDILQPYNWPLHLCNMAMFLIPICYIFKPKKLFYFTYFINVFGALLAILMPDYGADSTILRVSVIQFWVNHCCAFCMPLLGVALKIYPRPKLKQYFYSLRWFAIYFLVVMVLNSLYTGLDGVKYTIFGNTYTFGGTDYFFINSDFIAKKLGSFAKNIFNSEISFTIAGRTFKMHLLYEIVYFFSYAVLGFGVWFVYQLGFDISDEHYALHVKLKGIRLDKLALTSALNGRSLEEPMNENAGINLALKHFSKKYGMNKHYSVHDANLEVKGGEVFGFLGPNGAGKSTIIKSIVGIQPITEGEIEVCGYDVKKQSVYAKSLIGYVPDHYALYEKLTGREYLNYIADIFEISLEDRNKRLKEYIDLFELNESIDNKIKTYSHGMKQKITIIAALVHNPKVWILDEPLTGLDPNSIFQVKECMRRHAAAGNIVFFSSHLIDIVEKLCDRIAIIKHGEIQCVKKVSEIEKTGESLEDFFMNIING